MLKEGEVLRISIENFFVGEPFCVSENSWFRKSSWIGVVDGSGVFIRNRKKIWLVKESNPGPTAFDPYLPNLPAVFHFLMKRVGNFGLEKKKNDPTEKTVSLSKYICSKK